MEQSHQIEDRISALEDAASSLSKHVGQVVTEISHLNRSQQALFTKFDKLIELDRERSERINQIEHDRRERENERSKPQWQTIIGASTFVLLLGAAVLNPLSTNQTKLESNQKVINEKLFLFSEFMGASKARAAQDRQRIDKNEERTNTMLQNRFTDDDGAILRNQTMQRINQIEERVFNHQSDKGGHE